MLNLSKAKIAIIGLGYVGLPLALEFSKKFPTVGYDINKERINELEKGHDRTLEIQDDILALDAKVNFDSNALYMHPEIVEMTPAT